MSKPKIKEGQGLAGPSFPAEIRIEAMAAGGMGHGRLDGLVVFVPGGAPGDVLEVEEVKRAPDYAVGRIARIIEPSPLRREPPCPYFPACGGCQWQHLTYDAQIDAKKRILAEAFRIPGGAAALEADPVSPSIKEFHYRHRVQLKILTSRGEMRWGFFASSSHELVDVRECLIAHPSVNEIIRDLKGFLSFLEINPARLGGVDINVDGTGERIDFIVHSRRRKYQIPGHGRRIDYKTTDVRSLDVQVINASLIKKLPVKGGDFTFDTGGLVLSTGAGVFSQANLAMNPQLVEKVIEFTQVSSGDTVVDIYSGAGNYSVPLARQAAQVEAVENNPRACRYGQLNADKYGLENLRFHKKSAEEALDSLPRQIRAAIVNPPRVGARDIMERLGRLGPERVVYVSCNPSTLTRDVSILSRSGYRLTRLAPFDMFPQTHHLEVVALLVREGEGEVDGGPERQ